MQYEISGIYPTESSLYLSLNLKIEQKAFGEVHIHFGRYKNLIATVIVTSEKKIIDISFWRTLLSDIFIYRTAHFFGFFNNNKVEAFINIHHNDICINNEPIILPSNELEKIVYRLYDALKTSI